MSSIMVGFRFRPTNVEIVDYYLRVKNLGGGSSMSDVDKVIRTVNICSFDPWDLPSQSSNTKESLDLVWYFFGNKDNNKYKRGERQSRKTKSGFWKKTGHTMDITRKTRGKCEKIGEKRVLVFHLNKQEKTNWVMHEYQATEMKTTYTLCKVLFKGDAREMSSYPRSEVDQSYRSLIARMNNSSRSEGTPIKSQELHNPCQSTDFPSLDADFNNQLCDDGRHLLVVDDDEQSKMAYMQEHCNNHIPLEIPRMNNYVGTEGTPFKSKELANPSQFDGFPSLDVDFNNGLCDNGRSLLVDDDDDVQIVYMQEHCDDHILLEIPHMDNPIGSKGIPLNNQDQELQNPCQFIGFPGLDADYHNKLSDDDWRSLLIVSDEESKIAFMQEHYNDHIPQTTLTGVFIGHSSNGEPNFG